MAPPHFVADDVWLAGIGHLRADLAEREFSLNRLAAESGVHRMQVFRMMSGDFAGTVRNQQAIAEVMGRDPGFYFPRSALELQRAEALSALNGVALMATELRTRGSALIQAADILESVAS